MLIPNTAMLYGLMDVRGYEPMTPARTFHFFEQALKGEVDLGGSLYLLPRGELAEPVRRAFNLFNVQYILSSQELAAPHLEKVYDAEIKIYRNPTVLPRVFVVHKARIAPDAAPLYNWSHKVKLISARKSCWKREVRKWENGEMRKWKKGNRRKRGCWCTALTGWKSRQ